MNLKKLIPLTFSAVSLVSIPSVVCSCGNQYQPDYTIRCDTKEITWSLSQTTQTEETSQLYTIDKKEFANFYLKNGHLGTTLHKEKEGPSLGKNITPHLGAYNTLWFTDLEQTVTIGNYWLCCYGIYYGNSIFDEILAKNSLWFEFIVTG